MALDTPLIVVAQHLAVAAVAGLAVGVEREWSGHTRGPDARFAGVRTFLLLGVLGGIAGWLALENMQVVAAAVLLGGAALTTAAYSAVMRRPAATPDGTTEVAALVVLGIGFIAGIGYLSVASGIATVVVLVLMEKTRIHALLEHIDEVELRAGLQFAALALVVLPLLPEGPFGPWGGIKPRGLWIIVVIFSGLNFLGYLARRTVGAERGYGVTGLIGGVISSTAVTLDFSRASRRDAKVGGALAIGVIGACTVLLPRVTIVSAVLNPPVARALIPYLLPGFIVGAIVVAIGLRRPATTAQSSEETANPLRLGSAIQMALLFQVALTASSLAAKYFGSRGVISSAVVLGLTDMDALTVSMNRLGTSADMVSEAARAIAVGVLTNTIFKAGIATVVGTGRFRWMTLAGLLVLGAASAIGLWMGVKFG
ncbi:MAG: MgtC/SapB family protein [bacterium]